MIPYLGENLSAIVKCQSCESALTSAGHSCSAVPHGTINEPIYIDVDRDELLAGRSAINIRRGERGPVTKACEVDVEYGQFKTLEKPLEFGAILVFETYGKVWYRVKGDLKTHVF